MGQPFVTIEDYREIDRFVGVETVLEGAVRRYWKTTLDDCEPHCCGKFGPGGRVFRVQLPVTNIRGVMITTVVLQDSRFPDAFSCLGDEFTLCCDLSHGEPVLVHGEVSRFPPDQRILDRLYYIERPHLCKRSKEDR